MPILVWFGPQDLFFSSNIGIGIGIGVARSQSRCGFKATRVSLLGRYIAAAPAGAHLRLLHPPSGCVNFSGTRTVDTRR